VGDDVVVRVVFLNVWDNSCHLLVLAYGKNLFAVSAFAMCYLLCVSYCKAFVVCIWALPCAPGGQTSLFPVVAIYV
jgi:hypothetical protein